MTLKRIHFKTLVVLLYSPRDFIVRKGNKILATTVEVSQFVNLRHSSMLCEALRKLEAAGFIEELRVYKRSFSCTIVPPLNMGWLLKEIRDNDIIEAEAIQTEHKPSDG